MATTNDVSVADCNATPPGSLSGDMSTTFILSNAASEPVTADVEITIGQTTYQVTGTAVEAQGTGSGAASLAPPGGSWPRGDLPVSLEVVSVSETGPDGPPTLPGQDNPPRDLDGDGLYEDINGDGEFTILDVQIFQDVDQSPEVQNNAEFFDFNQDGGDVTVADVQALFDLLQSR